MATAKKRSSSTKKTAAKAGVKYAAKAATASQTAARSSAEWVKSSAAEWQKGASDWANQSAKMYQFPFNQENAAEAATEVAKNATEGMMNLATQLFNPSRNGFGAEQFSPQQAQEKLSRFAQESADQMSKSANSAQRMTAEMMELIRENSEAMVEVTNLSVTVSKEVAAECISYLNKTFAQNVEIGKQVHTCRTLNDLFDLASTCMKANLDSFFSETIKLSEKLFLAGNDISEPLNERMSQSTERLTRAFSA